MERLSLAISIGNTNIHFGLFKNKSIVQKFIIPTYDYNVKKLLGKLNRFNIDKAVICSVVPQYTKILKKDLKEQLSISHHLVIGENFAVPIKNLYRYPNKLGKDRLVNAYAAMSLYGAPCIVIDLGTALTFDIVSKNKEYLGGMILPGLNTSLRALSTNTALIPSIKLTLPDEFIGQDTKNSVLSGLINGFAALIEGLTKKIKRQLGYNAKVIATGGDIKFISIYTRAIDKIDQNLTLKGLNLLLINNYKV